MKEYYFDSRAKGFQKTDSEYVDDLKALAGDREIDCVVVDPSAASFILALGRAGFSVMKARNNVATGIRLVADALKSGKIVICPSCGDSLREFGLYRWQEGRKGDSPVKEHDHAMDDIRYFVATVLAQGEEQFYGIAVEREIPSARRRAGTSP